MKLGAKFTPRHILSRVPYIHSSLDKKSLPLVPDQTKYSLGMGGDWGDLGNKEYGCCIFAGYGHYKQSVSFNSRGRPTSVTTDQVLGWYSEVTGFNRNDPSTDNGSYAVEALDYFLKIGEIAAYGQVNIMDFSHVARAINIFGGLFAVLSMPLAWRGRKTWDIEESLDETWLPGSWGPHCVFIPDYDAFSHLTCVSWGDLHYVTREAQTAYMVEAFAIVTKDWLEEAGDTIQGFDLDGLKEQLKLVL